MSLRKDIPPHIVEILLRMNNKRTKLWVTFIGVVVILPLYKLFSEYKLVKRNKDDDNSDDSNENLMLKD